MVGWSRWGRVFCAILMVVSVVVAVTPSGAEAEPDCSTWYSPTDDEAVTPYDVTTRSDYTVRRAPLNDPACERDFDLPADSTVTVHAERGDWLYTVSPATNDWAWINQSALDEGGDGDSNVGCAIPAMQTTTPTDMTVTDRWPDLWIRSEPSRDCDNVIERVPAGAIVTRTAITAAGDWSFVRSAAGNAGWVESDRLQASDGGSTPTDIAVRARGNQGTETIDLLVNGETVASFSLSTAYQTFTHRVPADTTIGSLQVGHSSGDWPNAVVVDYLDVDESRFETEASNVRSYGSHDSQTGCAEGNKQSEWLSCNNGWFDYPIQPTNEHLARLKSTPYRNTNHDNSPYANTPSASLPIDSLLVPWQEYRDNGGITRVIAGSGSFRVYCEFSHFAYDDPILAYGQPGASHLHMFFGNTDANAYSTPDSILNSGSSTCNGQELNRTAYWVPAFIDQNGNVPVPSDALVYYKGYYGDDSSPGPFNVYPDGSRFVSNRQTINNSPAGYRPYEHLFFRCYLPGTGGGNDINTKSLTIPNCGDEFRLEMNVRFQVCWNGEDPSNWRENFEYSPNWPTSGQCGGDHPYKLPQLEYRIFFDDHTGSENWILSSDVSMADQRTITGRGDSLHGDWFGGWNKTINQRWIDNCVNINNTDCDEGLLDSPNQNDPSDPTKGLRIRPQYTGQSRVPGRALLEDLCHVDKAFTGQASVALCNPGGDTPEPPDNEPADIELSVRARGNQGTENLNVFVNGDVVASFAVTTDYQTFAHSLPGGTTVESLRVGHSSGDWPNAVVVDYLDIDGSRFETEAANVLSYGSHDSETGCAEGNKQSEWLSCNNGWFEYPIRQIG